MSDHEEVIQMLLKGYAQTLVEAAAAEEIRILRARVAELERQFVEKPAEAPRKVKRGS
jgi:ketopantoate reductase